MSFGRELRGDGAKAADGRLMVMTCLFKTRAAFDGFMASRRHGAFHVLILHDDACAPSRYRCAPRYEVRHLSAESVIEGVRLQRQWAQETSS